MGVFAGQYDKSLIDVIWNNRLFTGYGDNIISVEQGADVMAMYKGVTGRIVFNWSMDTSAIITIVLEHTSDDNVFLEQAAKSKIIAPFLAKDRSLNRIIAQAAQTAVMRRPNFARGEDVTNNAWAFGLANATSGG